jgi:hypothetical protein
MVETIVKTPYFLALHPVTFASAWVSTCLEAEGPFRKKALATQGQTQRLKE